ncbi:hypothetical protein PybrP1_013033 [[Pythium] brassicae (nom. inval.)]|nr:hypothetical protein PybrP1_013033 [[Pythium] brassicae (nom. inval.)]
MGKIVKFCNALKDSTPDACSRIADTFKYKVCAKIKKLTLEVALKMAPTHQSNATESDARSELPDDSLSFVNCAADAAEAVPVDAMEGRVDEESQAYLSDPLTTVSMVLSYWKQRSETRNSK